MAGRINQHPITTGAGGTRIHASALAPGGLTVGGLPQLVGAILTARDDPQAVLKDEPKRIRVTRHTIDGQDWVVKRFRLTGVRNHLRARIRRSPAWREWRGAATLKEIGIRCIEPIALCEGPTSDPWNQAIVMPFIEGLTLGVFLQQEGDPATWTPEHRAWRRWLADALGEQLGTMVSRGIVNRDHKVGNLIVDPACRAGAAPPMIIDPAGLKTRRKDIKVLRALALLLRTAVGSGHVTLREQATCLRAFLKACPDFATARRRTPRQIGQAVRGLMDHV